MCSLEILLIGCSLLLKMYFCSALLLKTSGSTSLSLPWGKKGERWNEGLFLLHAVNWPRMSALGPLLIPTKGAPRLHLHIHSLQSVSLLISVCTCFPSLCPPPLSLSRSLALGGFNILSARQSLCINQGFCHTPPLVCDSTQRTPSLFSFSLSISGSPPSLFSLCFHVLSHAISRSCLLLCLAKQLEPRDFVFCGSAVNFYCEPVAQQKVKRWK